MEDIQPLFFFPSLPLPLPPDDEGLGCSVVSDAVAVVVAVVGVVVVAVVDLAVVFVVVGAAVGVVAGASP